MRGIKQMVDEHVVNLVCTVDKDFNYSDPGMRNEIAKEFGRTVMVGALSRMSDEVSVTYDAKYDKKRVTGKFIFISAARMKKLLGHAFMEGCRGSSVGAARIQEVADWAGMSEEEILHKEE